jgi:TetR/AcrR family transcriptional regulator, mexJK operon transcriptional repressor
MELQQNGHERRQTQRRAEILAAATALFFEKGYGRTSMDDVLNIIGGSKRTLYHHFKGKEELFAAIVSNVLRRVLTGLEGKVTGDFRRDLLAMGIRYLEALFMPETLALYRAMISEAAFFPELARTCFENGPITRTRSFVQFFEAQNRLGKIVVRDPETAARHFIAMLRADYHLAALLTGRKFSSRQIREMVEKAVDTLMVGAIEKADQKKARGY